MDLELILSDLKDEGKRILIYHDYKSDLTLLKEVLAFQNKDVEIYLAYKKSEKPFKISWLNLKYLALNELENKKICDLEIDRSNAD